MDEAFVATNGIMVDDAFWQSIKERPKTEEEMRAIADWKNQANVQGLLRMNPPHGEMEPGEHLESR